MNTRIFGQTNSPVSETGLGCWQLGDDCWGDLSEATAEGILQSAVDQGITFFDTADVYGAGRSESLIGRFIKTCSEEIFIATKLGRGPGTWPNEYSKASLTAATEASLKRLGVETLDLTQLHCIPLEELRKGEVFEHMNTLQAEGKIRNWGVSVEDIEQAQACLDAEGLTSFQVIFNIFRQKPVHELFDAAKARNIAIIVRLPMASGVLAGKFTGTETFAENDHRNFNADGQMFNVGETFAGIPFPKAVELANELKALCPEGLTMPQFAMRWILDHDAVTTVIPGASRVAHVESNASASALAPLSSELHSQLAAFYTEKVHAHIRGIY
ncbi:MAG: aryl-alcohol dehydrogenase-like predicted oxidoreductase [Kiritimatiellia bacterium]|jgi:aryl-alcohol dehydrogenase-like predicted oxidoreductase